MLLTKETVIFLLFVLILGIFINKLNLKVTEITEKEKCPACFGISACKDVEDMHLLYTDFYSFFNNLLSTKNVYYGKYKDSKVIMKKLARKSELDSFDEIICSTPELHEICFNEPRLKEAETNYYKLIISELTNPNISDPHNKIRLCPTAANINELLKNVQTEKSVNKNDYYKYLWTSIKINPEPIFLQILSSNDNWPVPKYFGSCGRLIIEEYVGLPLLNYDEEPWIKRAKIASSLLDAAYQFTFKNPQFAFYLTDMSGDNIAINDQDEAIFVDLENIIIVDKFPPIEVTKRLRNWNSTYTNEVIIDCDNCFVFSPHDICNHKISDHNYYAICQHILVQTIAENGDIEGFLHDPPDNILKHYPTLTNLLKQCSTPDIRHSRIDSGIQLKKILDLIVNEYTK